MQDLSLHRLPVSCVVELIDEVPRGHFGLVADYSDRVIGRKGPERRDVHAVDDSSDGLTGPPSQRESPQLVTYCDTFCTVSA
jgi:hypothetical protein